MAGKNINKCLFLDRDGIVNINYGYVHKIEDFHFNKEVFTICKHFIDLNFKIVIVTNQSGIGRGLFTLEDYRKITLWMLSRFEENGIRVDLVVASPINPGNVRLSKELEFRRKPNPGMILDAQEILNINLMESVMIGDGDSDIDAARNAGIPNIIKVGYPKGRKEKIQYFNNLREVVDHLRESRKIE